MYIEAVGNEFHGDVYADLLRVWPFAWGYFSPEGLGEAPLVAQRLEMVRAARGVLVELAALKVDWDGYGGSSISVDTRRNAEHFLDIIEAAPSGLPIPDIAPTPSGTLAFEWETRDSSAYIEIGKSRFSGYIKGRGQSPALLEGQAGDLDQQILATIQMAISPPLVPSPLVTEVHTQTPPYAALAA